MGPPPKGGKGGNAPVAPKAKAGSSTAQPGWREKLALEEATKKKWGDVNAKSLPAGSLDNPQWNTIFLAETLSEGSLCVATLSGTYLLKSELNCNLDFPITLWQAEHFPNIFNRWIGAPSPNARMVLPMDAEFEEILNGLRNAAKILERKGVDKFMKLKFKLTSGSFSGKCPITIMEFIDRSVDFNAPAELASKLFERSDGGGEMATGTPESWGSLTQRMYMELMRVFPVSPAQLEQVTPEAPDDARLNTAIKVRLHSLGRILAADLFLGQRDRFVIPGQRHVMKEGGSTGNSEEFECGSLEAYLQWLATWKVGDEGPDKRSELMNLLGNIGNVIVQDIQKPDFANFYFIDNGGTSFIHGEKVVNYMEPYIKSILSESADAGGPLSAPVLHFEFMRLVVRVYCCGHVLSDAALRELRLGFLHGVQKIVQPDDCGTSISFRKLVEEIKNTYAISAKQRKNAELVKAHEDALQQGFNTLMEVQKLWRKFTAEFSHLFDSLPPPVEACPLDSISHPDVHIEEDVIEEARKVGASPAVWNALHADIRAEIRQDWGL